MQRCRLQPRGAPLRGVALPRLGGVLRRVWRRRAGRKRRKPSWCQPHAYETTLSRAVACGRAMPTAGPCNSPHGAFRGRAVRQTRMSLSSKGAPTSPGATGHRRDARARALGALGRRLGLESPPCSTLGARGLRHNATRRHECKLGKSSSLSLSISLCFLRLDVLCEQCARQSRRHPRVDGPTPDRMRLGSTPHRPRIPAGERGGGPPQPAGRGAA